MKSRTTALLLAIAVLGCSGGDAPADDAAATAGEAADQVSRQADAGDHIPMTRETFARYLAAVEELVVAVQENPAMAEALGINADDSPEQAAEQLEQHPEVVRVLAKHDFSPQQYASYTMRMAGAMFAAGALDSGVIDEIPEDADTEDTQFMTDNWDWVQQEYARIREKFPQNDASGEQEYDDEYEG